MSSISTILIPDHHHHVESTHMKWNAGTMSWEGNEEEIDVFEGIDEQDVLTISSTKEEASLHAVGHGSDKFHRFSDNVLIYILKRVPPTTLARSSSVCKRWRDLIKDHDNIWEHALLNTFLTPIWKPILQRELTTRGQKTFLEVFREMWHLKKDLHKHSNEVADTGKEEEEEDPWVV